MVESERVINGEESVAHSWPWQVSIQGQDNSHYCGASLLSPSWVLTAAHCANIVFIGTYTGDQVVVGMHDRQAEEAGKEKIKIGAKFIHPEYDSPDRANDIALLRLDSPASLGDTVAPPCLPKLGDFGDSSSFPAGSDCVLTGWGMMGEGETTCFGDQHVKVKEFGLKVELDRPLKIVHPLAAYACLAQSHKAPFLCSSGKATKIQVVDFVCVLRVYPKTGHCLWQCRESSLALLWRQLAKVKVAHQNACIRNVPLHPIHHIVVGK